MEGEDGTPAWKAVGLAALVYGERTRDGKKWHWKSNREREKTENCGREKGVGGDDGHGRKWRL